MSGVETLPVPMTPMRPGINGQSSPLVTGFSVIIGGVISCVQRTKKASH